VSAPPSGMTKLHPISKKRKAFFIVCSLGLALILTFFALEIIFRITQPRGFSFESSRFDEVTGAGLSPGGTILYRSPGGGVVRRKVNSWGYLDREHRKGKTEGTFRIGFFGDSYTEARQVPLEQTFFRLIENQLAGERIECFSFGISGFSTLQSYLTCQKWLRELDLDLVVYIFCENDLGDQIKEIKRHSLLPYAVPEGDGFRVEWFFRKGDRSKLAVYNHTIRFLASRSILLGTLVQRIRLLMRYGVKVKTNEAERLMATKADGLGVPDPNDLPSTWPATWREQAETLGEAVIRKWAREVCVHSRRFAVMYVPRAGELEKAADKQDSWKFWLESLCRKERIPWIDPSPELIAMAEGGTTIFSDHFSKEGHLAFAEAFVRWFRAEQLRQ